MKTKSKYQVPMRSFLPLTALITIIGLTAALKVQAASQTWTNAPTDANWITAANWNGNAVPGALNSSATTDIATFTNALPISGIGGVAAPIIYDNTRSVRSILFDGISCGAYQLGAIDGINDASILYLGNSGNLTVTPAVTTAQKFAGVVRVKLPSSTNGRFDITNNAASPAASLYFQTIFNESANTRPLNLFLAGSNTGTNTIAQILDGGGANGAIQLDVSGPGNWVLSGANELPQKTSASQVAHVFVNGGTLVVKDAGSLGAITAPNLIVQTAGTLQIDAVTLNNAGITLRSGGTIRMNGSGTVNSLVAGNAVATSATLATTSASDVMTVGIVSGGAADSVLHVAGSGTVLLSQPGNYAGKWSVDAGTNQLGVAGGLGTGANLNINAGAVFDVTPLGATTYTLDTKALSANGTGTAVGSTASTIMADPGATVDFASKPLTLTFTPASTNGDSGHPALFAARGTMSFNGNAITVSNAFGTSLGAGTYQLVHQASGSIISSGAFVTLFNGSALGAGLIGEIVAVGGDLNLVVSAYTPKSLVWTGGDPSLPNIWDRLTTTNWLAGATPSTFNIYDGVTFNSVGSTNPVVYLATTMAPSSVTVDTSANNYAFITTGSGQIAGGAVLIKKSSGILFLNTANTYSGGTVISNGTVKIGADNALPSTGFGDVAIYSPAVFDLNNFSDTINGLIGNGTVDITGGGASTLTIGNNGDSGLFSGVIQNTFGTLGLFKSGNGTETLTASNSYAGPTTIDTGTLRVTNLYALGSNAVTINSGNLDLATSLIVASINGNGGTIVNNSTATTVTNTLIVQGTSTSGSLISGRVAVLVNAGTLRLNAANTYSGGTIISEGAGLAFGGGAANAGAGGIIASNNTTIRQANTGSGSSGPGNAITTVDGATVTFTSGTTANNWAGQFIGSATATNVFSGGAMSIGGAYSFSNFLGTVIITNGTARLFNAVNGGDNTTFIFTNGGGMFTRDATIVRLGALFGNGTITGPSVGTVGTFWIGAKGIDSEYSGTIAGSNNIVKTGVGRLTLDGAVVTTNTDSATYTNYIYAPAISYLGSTTVSNGVLALSVPNNLDNSPTITLAASTAVLDASKMGYVTNFNDINSNPDSALVTNGVFELLATTPLGTPQTLAGIGTIKGNGVISSGSINPGVGGANGTLSISNGLVINAGATNFFDLSDDPSGLVKPNDMIKVQGNVGLSGGSIITIGGTPKVGTYVLIKYGGNLTNEGGVVPSGPISNFTLAGGLSQYSRATMVLSNAPGEVDLIVVSLNNLNLTWTGDGVSNLWDVVNSYTWTNGGASIQFYQLDNVTFDDTANPTNDSVFLSGTLLPGAITVNSVTNYILGGNGTIGGVGTLIKKGSGTLILTNGANSYTGGTILSNGVLNVGSDSGGNQNDLALGSGPVTVNTGAELRFGGNTGATVVNHLITNAITVNGGVVKAQDGSQHLTNSIVTITANGGTFQTVFATKTLVLDSPVVGTGPLTISVPAGFVGASVVFNNPSNTVSGPVTIATNGVLTLNGSSGLSNSPSIDIQLGGALDTTGRTNRLLTLLSGQTLKGNGTLRGNLTTAAGSTLSPGASAGILGILTVANTTGVTNTATLGGTTIMELNRAVTPNSDQLLTAGTNVFGGALTVNNIGAALQLNDTFQLFTNAATRGAFAVTNLPSLTSGLGWSNSLAINGRLTVIATVNTNPTNITAVVNGNQLTLNWPADHTGWHLQIQTNSLSTGLNTNWVTLPGSDLVNSTNMTINPANGAVFYRMVYP